MASDCKYEWCDGAEHYDGVHTGDVATVTGTTPGAVPSTLECTIYDSPRTKQSDRLASGFHFEIDWWDIDFDDVEQEIADLQNMVTVFAAAMRQVKSEITP